MPMARKRYVCWRVGWPPTASPGTTQLKSASTPGTGTAIGGKLPWCTGSKCE